MMKKILLSFTAVLFCISVMAQNSVNLKMNLEKNKVYRFSSASEQTIVQTVNGNQQTIESKTNNAVSIKMVDATPAFLITEVHFDTLATTTNTMGKTISHELLFRRQYPIKRNSRYHVVHHEQVK